MRKHKFWMVVTAAVMLLTLVGTLETCSDQAGPPGNDEKFSAILLTPGFVTLAPGGVQPFVASCLTASLATIKCPNLAWTATGGARVSTSGTPDTAGTYTAGPVTGSYLITAAFASINQTTSVTIISGGQIPNVTVDPSQTFQTMLGWEANISSGWSTTAAVRNAIIDLTANDMGITRLRIPVKSSAFAVSPPDFSVTDSDMTEWAMPIRSRVLARGEPFSLLIDYRGPLPDTATYAGQVVQVLQHLRQTYNVEPDLFIIKNEPDNGPVQTQLTGLQVGAYIRATGARARAAGFNQVMFSTPTTMDARKAVPFLSAILSVPGAAQYVAEVSYHNYSGVLGNTRTSIRDAAAISGFTTAMTEHHSADNIELYLDLTEANVSAWERNSLAGTTGFALFQVDTVNNTFRPIPEAWFLRQYFKYVRPGMTRIEATSTQPSLVPTAYQAPTGETVVVVRATAATTVRIGGLPGGTYTPSFSTAAQQGVVGAPITIVSGQTLTTTIPGSGLLTVSP